MANVTVYRVRFWDINTSKYVMSEGMMTEAAAWTRNLQVDKTTARQVDGVDVYMGIYKPRPIIARHISRRHWAIAQES